jgi:hypothetical protein
MHDGQRRREQEVGALQRSEAIDYSGNVLWSDKEGVGGQTTVEMYYSQSRRDKEVGALQRSEVGSTRRWRSVTVEKHTASDRGGYALWSEQDGAGGWSTAEKGSSVHQMVDMCNGPRGCRRSDHGGL